MIAQLKSNMIILVLLFMFINSTDLSGQDNIIEKKDSTTRVTSQVKVNRIYNDSIIWRYTKRLSSNRIHRVSNQDNEALFYKDSTILMYEKKYGSSRRILMDNQDSLLFELQEYFYSENSEGMNKIKYLNQNPPVKEYSAEGIWVNRKRNTGIFEIIEYKNDKKHGSYRSFHDNHSTKEIGQYSQNFKIGQWIEFYENGRIKALGNYYPDTNWIHKLCNEECIDSLHQSGLENYGDILPPAGDFIRIVNYKKDDVWYYYDEDANLIRKEFFDKGILVKKILIDIDDNKIEK